MATGTMGRYCMVCGTHLRPYELICPNCFPKEKDVKQQRASMKEIEERIWGCSECGARGLSHDLLCSKYVAVEDRCEMNFSKALEAVKAGKKVQRAGWEGKGMFIFLVPGSTFTVNRPPLLGIYPEGTEINYRAHIDMRTVGGQVEPWHASQTDILADDWQEADMRKEFAKKPTILERCHSCLAVVPDPYKRCPECFPLPVNPMFGGKPLLWGNAGCSAQKYLEEQEDKAKSTDPKTIVNPGVPKLGRSYVIGRNPHKKDDPCVHCGTPRPPKPIHEHCTRCGGILE